MKNLTTHRGPNKPNRLLAFYVFILAALSQPDAVMAFTQSGANINFLGSGIPMGHEWVTRMAALELIGGDPIADKLIDPNDPRKMWDEGLAKNIDLSSPAAQREVKRIKSMTIQDKRYESGFELVYASILGERWVDIGGFNVTKGQVPKNEDCFDAVAQEPVEVQVDHFMRRYDDRGGEGGLEAAERAQERFINHFVKAATAPKMNIIVWDGGGYSKKETVDFNYFLFGRVT